MSDKKRSRRRKDVNGDDKKFIQLVKENEIIWNDNCMNKNSQKTSEAWKIISDACDMPVQTCLKKWQGLCECYNAEVNNEITSCADMCRAKSCPAKNSTKCKYRDCMDFLRLQMKPPGTCPMEKPVEEPVEDDTKELNKESSVLSTKEIEPSTSRIHLEQAMIDTMKSVLEYLNKLPVPSPDIYENDEDVLFCRSLASKLKKIHQQYRNDAKLGIFKFLCEFEDQMK